MLSLYLVPFTQNLGRIYLKNSNVDFLPSLITEKKFINVFKNLTIFVDSYDQKGNIKKIYINEKLDQNSSKIIVAESGKIQKREDQFMIKLFTGSIINSNENNFYNINFKETEYDLSKFSSNTVTYQKIQQINSINLLYCVYDFYIKQKKDNKICPRKIESITEEIYKRTVIPLYILILSLISSSLLIKPKSNKYMKYYKTFIFVAGFFFIVISQIGSKLITQNLIMDLLVLFSPICFVGLFYLTILFKTNFKLNYL